MRNAAQGIAMLWHGDYNNARQLLSAMDRRLGNIEAGRSLKRGQSDEQKFYSIRQARAHRSRMLSLLLVPLSVNGTPESTQISLTRAPEVGAAIAFGYEQSRGSYAGQAAVSLQELTGVLSAHQWFLNGVEVPALGKKIYPSYGTFMPTRQEYVDLVAKAPIKNAQVAFDIGTGTGVLAALLVARGVKKVIGTDIHQRAVDCANQNFAQLGISSSAHAELTNMFPDGKAPLIICNPPWLPGSAPTSLDAAIYDPGSKMLLQFLRGLPEHLTEDGEAWLIISDLAELLGLRTSQALATAINDAGLKVAGRIDAQPQHARAFDQSDLLYSARSVETTTLWRLAVQ
ncbi:methyltransferase [Glutamicibacter mishrai]|uniref:Methyltransferase domain-containing protein n=1 Tax=Glutamicibacter mishrai TaxID=1775880 RepID=A0A6H0SM94_9MICC|nr:methyltransferase [Glutamicibacter mishrai]QIV88424.1 methyltransferase domain-containing protein [Glutamicibacter mishrai]